MQAVTRLLEGDGARILEEVLGDLFSPVRGEAVHEEHIVFGVIEQALVHLEALKAAQAKELLIFMAHGGPHVRDDEIGVCYGGFRVVAEGRAIAVALKPFRVGLEAPGAGHGQVKLIDVGRDHVALAHVEAIANEGHAFALDRAPMAVVGLHVREHLAGVLPRGHRVDDGNGGCLSEVVDLSLIRGADHGYVDHFRKHAGRIFHQLPPAQLRIPGR